MTPEQLWAGITQPDLIAGWLGPVTRFDLHVDGEIVLLLHPGNGAWLRGNVTAIEVPRMIEFTWNVPAHGTAPAFVGGALRLEVQRHERGACLKFSHALPGPARVLDILAASHLRLEQLSSKPGRIASVDRERFLALRARYEAAAAL